MTERNNSDKIPALEPLDIAEPFRLQEPEELKERSMAQMDQNDE